MAVMTDCQIAAGCMKKCVASEAVRSRE